MGSAVLKISDLDGRVLTIERGLSDNVLGTTKSSRTRRLTLGKTTIEMIEKHVKQWDKEFDRAEGDDWLFSADPSRSSYLKIDLLSRRMRRLGSRAGVSNRALHRLRHAVATHLVGSGKLLKAQARLGHRDPSTTLRHYAHATILDDDDVADEINNLLAFG